MMKLIGTDGNKYYAFELLEGCYLVGRKKACELYIPNGTVSRRHAQIEVTAEGETFLTDLGSHNGTVLNTSAVTERVKVKLGDKIMFGETQFELTDQDRDISRTPVSVSTQLAQHDLEKSVFLPIDEALKPLPSKVTEIPAVLSTIFEMARTLVLSEPQENMLQRSLGLIAKVIPAERLAVLTMSGEGDVYIAASHLPSDKDPGSLTLSRTIINDILSENQAILIGDPMDDPRFSGQQSIIMSEMKSAMAVPLFDEGTVLGILYVDTTNPMHRYNNDFLKLLATFGNILGSRLVNYALMAERAERQLIEAELNRASSIQKKLLDINPPVLAGYAVCAFQEQCRAVGGDMYDMCLLPDGRLLFLVADVSGKGLGAAMLMSNILASFRILYCNPQLDLTRVVQQVSAQLFQHSAPEDFATLFIGMVDPEKSEVRFVNAGHNPAAVVRADGTLEYLDASGVIIGALADMEWTEGNLTLGSGDLLFVYSDGVTEAESIDEQYGEARMETALAAAREMSPEEITNRVMNEIEDFVGDCPQSDDITMLAIKRDE